MIENNRYFWSHLKTKTVTVSVAPKPQKCGVVFRVGNMVDRGDGRQMVTLDHLDSPQNYAGTGALRNMQTGKQNDVPVPFRMGTFDFLYTSRRKPYMQDVRAVLSTLYQRGDVQQIVAEVICPGDLLVFIPNRETGGMVLDKVMRLMTNPVCATQDSQAEHAL